MAVAYEKLGLKVGLEIHQQLATATKLFCECPADLSSEPPEFTLYRRLRPTQSELGAVDPAAAFEYQRGRGFLYEVDAQSSCLVEMDEEPPHALNAEAVNIALTIAMMIDANPVDEIHVMRKIVIDGSNTTGFQRTCIISLGGAVVVEGKALGIQTVSLEEDAARKTREEDTTTGYRLDRLCIPLIEITTSPEISTPKEAEKVALALGRILRSTRKVKRGLGTIRQDLNISITRGALIEIKGVQELDLISSVVEGEVRRQKALLRVAEELRSRGINKENLFEEIFDVSAVFYETKCGILRKALDSKLNVVSMKLAGFSGLLGKELTNGLRFGTELSDYAKFWGGAGGIFHTDELPAYGITENEVTRLREMVHAAPQDAVVIVAQRKEEASNSLHAVYERALVALDGVPSETRAANPDGTTRFSRPRPGAARMYPETDVPPFVVTERRIAVIRENLPPLPEVKLAQMIESYQLSTSLASRMMNSEYFELFERVVTKTSLPAAFVAATLVETTKSLRREGVEMSMLSEMQVEDVFRAIDEGEVAKEAISEILQWLASNPSQTIVEALKSLNLRLLSVEELEKNVYRVVEENRELIKTRGMDSTGPLMGLLMRELRGKVDTKQIMELLRKQILSKLNQGSKK